MNRVPSQFETLGRALIVLFVLGVAAAAVVGLDLQSNGEIIHWQVLGGIGVLAAFAWWRFDRSLGVIAVIALCFVVQRIISGLRPMSPDEVGLSHLGDAPLYLALAVAAGFLFLWGDRPEEGLSPERKHRVRTELLVCLCLVVVAAGMRFYKLDLFPGGLVKDEAINGLTALKLMDGTVRGVFTTYGQGKPTFPLILLGFCYRLFGVSIYVTRAYFAGLGVLAVVAAYFFFRQLFRLPMATVATLMFAASRWHLHFSRVCFAVNMMLPFQFIGLAFLLRSLRRESIWDAFFAGVSFGISIHTYAGARFIPIALAAFSVFHLIRRRGEHPVPLMRVLFLAAGGLLIVLPLVHYAWCHSKEFMLRGKAASVLLFPDDACLAAMEGLKGLWPVVWPAVAGVVSLAAALVGCAISLRRRVRHRAVWAAVTLVLILISVGLSVFAVYQYDADTFAENWNAFRQLRHSGVYGTWLGQVRESALMFNLSGDPEGRHNIASLPMLEFYGAVLLLAGLCYALARWRDDRVFLLLSCFAVIWFGQTFFIPTPHAVRTLGLTALIYALICMPLERVRQGLWATFGEVRGAMVGVPLLLAGLWVGYQDASLYFGRQLVAPEYFRKFYVAVSRASEEAARQIREGHTVVTTREVLRSTQGALLLEGRKPGGPPLSSSSVPYPAPADRDLWFVFGGGRFSGEESPTLAALRHYYGGGELIAHRDPRGPIACYAFGVPKDYLQAHQGLVECIQAQEPGGTERLVREEVANLPLRAGDHGLSAERRAEWRGLLLVEQQGAYFFVLKGTVPATLTVGGEVLRGPLGRASLMVGPYDIHVEVPDWGPGDGLALQWKLPGRGSGEWRPIPAERFWAGEAYPYGLLAHYYLPPPLNQRAFVAGLEGWIDAVFRPNGTCTEEPVHRRAVPWVDEGGPAGMPFGVVWTARLVAPKTGTYIFETHSDDGSDLFIDGKRVVDNWGFHTARFKRGTIRLRAGEHHFRMRYFDAGGGRQVTLRWKRPHVDAEFVPLPEGTLFPEEQEFVRPLGLQ